MGGLREKYQNDVLRGNMNMAPLNEWLLEVSCKFQNVNMYRFILVICFYKYMSVKIWATSCLALFSWKKATPSLVHWEENKLILKSSTNISKKKYCHLHLLHYLARKQRPSGQGAGFPIQGSCNQEGRLSISPLLVQWNGYQEFLGT